MPDNEPAQLRDDFIARLDEAMRTVPHGVANDIRQGILEELDGLDADATAARVTRLGDPMAIAAGARAEGADAAAPAPVVVTVAPPKVPMTQTQGFAVVAALCLSIGGFIVPVVGWVIGAVLVCLSPLWRRGEKVVAFVAPFVVAGVSVLIISLLEAFGSGGSSSYSAGTFDAPEVANPLVPSGYDLWFSSLFLALILVPVSGIWLLWRLRGRTAA